MKKILLYFLLFFCFLLTSCSKEEEVTTTEERPHLLENQLGFIYQDITIKNNNIEIDAFLTNGFEETVYPLSLYIKIYYEDTIYAEDTLDFKNNYYIKGKTINKVTILIPLNQDIIEIKQYDIYYEYKINEVPITLEV